MIKPIGVKILLAFGYIKLVVSIIVSLIILFFGSVFASFVYVLANMSAGDPTGTGLFGTMAVITVLVILPTWVFVYALRKRKYVLTILMLVLFILVPSGILFRIISLVMLGIVLADNETKMYLRGRI